MIFLWSSVDFRFDHIVGFFLFAVQMTHNLPNWCQFFNVIFRNNHTERDQILIAKSWDVVARCFLRFVSFHFSWISLWIQTWCMNILCPFVSNLIFAFLFFFLHENTQIECCLPNLYRLWSKYKKTIFCEHFFPKRNQNIIDQNLFTCVICFKL